MTKPTFKEWGLYLGQKAVVCAPDDNRPCQKYDSSRKLITIGGVRNTGFFWTEIYDSDNESWHLANNVKPVLRALTQMTQEEKNEVAEFFLETKCVDWLTQKGFAMRKEFERGVAVMEV